MIRIHQCYAVAKFFRKSSPNIWNCFPLIRRKWNPNILHQILQKRALTTLLSPLIICISYMVYPGAVHSRFEHSLGVYWLSSEAINKLKTYQGSELEIDRVDTQTVKIADPIKKCL